MIKRFLLPLVLLLGLCLAFITTPVHAASPVRNVHFTRPNTTQQVAPSTASAQKPLVYHGGTIQNTVQTVYAIWWEPTLNVEKNYNSTIQTFFNNEGASGLVGSEAAQYPRSNPTSRVNSSVWGAGWTDTKAYPSRGYVTDADIQAEVTRAISFKGWTRSTNHLFIVYLQRGEDQCWDTSSNRECIGNGWYCAYHANNGSTIYAVLPYLQSYSGCDNQMSAPYPNNRDVDNEIDTTSHEQMESATDPQFTGYYVDDGTQYTEIADICSSSYADQNPDGSDIKLNGHGYYIQEEWSNIGNKCAFNTHS